ncbi:MAG: tetratricopeptide repeat protein, partial [Cyclobacteriaceae bacterium]|nr:tetratricopeptide repeat protein [Cyclobacteriaceae bacterium]
GDSRAEETYLMAIRHKQSVADAYCNLGIMLADRDEPAQAVNYFTSCLRENPRHFEAHYNLANLYSDKGSLELAQLHYEITIGLEPEFPNSHYNLGLVQISMKKYREAVESIRSYARLATDYDHKAVNELIKTLTSIAQ